MKMSLWNWQNWEHYALFTVTADILTFWSNIMQQVHFNIPSSVKPMLNGHSKIDKTKIFMTNGNLMKVESMAECSPIKQ